MYIIHAVHMYDMCEVKNGIFPVMSVNKNVIIIRDSGPSNVNFQALRALEKEKNTCIIW